VTESAAPRLGHRDAGPLALLLVVALAVPVATASWVARDTAMPLAWLGVFFDGYLYIEIARSFPLPYAPEGRDYLGQAPGYPALIYLARLLTPASPANWGALALAASWIPAALSAAAFYACCRPLGVPPFWPSLAFAVGNPRWITVSATAHSESLAMLFGLLSLAAHLRGRLGWTVAWLSLAGLTRFPALLVGVALAFDVLVAQRRRDPRTLVLLGVPVLVFAAHNLYLLLHIPGYAGIAEAHRVFWDTHLTWPFEPLISNAWKWLRGTAPGPNFALTYASVAFYLASLVLGVRERERRLRFLALWVAAIVLFHVSLAGEWGGFDFARLAILAWPAGLLLVWRRLAVSAPLALTAAGWALGGALSVAIAVHVLSGAVRWQRTSYPWPAIAVRRLTEEQPRWFDFGAGFAPPAASPAPRRPAP
jgi:hypothetical protein